MSTDYQRIGRAIAYLQQNVAEQPKLKTVASACGLSPSHFQRVFKRWAGVSPKRYLQFLTVEYCSQKIRSSSTLDVSLHAGLSSTSRLHEHFINMAAVTPGQYRSSGMGVNIIFGFAESPFGIISIAKTENGICALNFSDQQDEPNFKTDLQKQWPHASLARNDKIISAVSRQIFSNNPQNNFVLAPMGSNFQIHVWKALLNIHPGQLATYKQIASAIGQPQASRAVARAIASNPIAYLIPCHRVLRSDGSLSGYRWGTVRKQAMIAREAAQNKSS